MKKILRFLFSIILLGCNESNKSTEELKAPSNLETVKKPGQNKLQYKIDFDSTKVSKFTIEHSELTKSKALAKKLSAYSSAELNTLPEFKRLTLGIVIPYDISKESLINTFKYLTNEKSKENNDIDEIIIFAYDDKNDLINSGGFYTFGKSFWGPNGKTGNVTPTIAEKNIRVFHEFQIHIKDKVGKIKKSDLPTKRELNIYNTIMAEENIGMDEDLLNHKVMKKYGIKTEKELKAIWLKVAAYKF